LVRAPRPSAIRRNARRRPRRPVRCPRCPRQRPTSSQVKSILSPKQRAKPKTNARKTGRRMRHCVAKVGVAPPGFEVRRRMSRVAFRVFPAGRAGDTRAAFCAISCFVSRFRVCVCVYVVFVGALERRKRVSNQSPVPFFRFIYGRIDQLLSRRGPQKSAAPSCARHRARQLN
jgi:hypothetical protein